MRWNGFLMCFTPTGMVRQGFGWPLGFLLVLLSLESSLLGQSLEKLEPAYLESVPSGAGLPKVEQQIIDSTNKFRQQQDLAKVTPNQKLTDTAKYFAAYMARTGEYGHEADGNRPSQRVSLHDYDYCLVAENIAFYVNPAGVDSPKLASQFMQGWRESKQHRENMLDPALTQVGVAVAQNPETKKYYAVQLFGRPKSQAIRFQIVNQTQEELSYVIRNVRQESQPESLQLPANLIRTHLICRPSRMKLSGSTDSLEIKVAEGHRYTIRSTDEGLQVTQQRTE